MKTGDFNFSFRSVSIGFGSVQLQAPYGAHYLPPSLDLREFDPRRPIAPESGCRILERTPATLVSRFFGDNLAWLVLLFRIRF